MSYINEQLGAGEKIKDSYDKINRNSNEANAHINNTGNKHGTDNIINNSSLVIGASATEAIDELQTQITAIGTGDSNALIGVYKANDVVNTNDYEVTIADLTLFTDLRINLKATNINTGASTLNVNGLGTKSIKYLDVDGITKLDLVGGELYGYIELQYDGSDFIIVGKDTNLASQLDTIQNVLSEYSVNVSTLGIYPDGNNYTAIINDNLDLGKHLYFPNGEYTVDLIKTAIYQDVTITLSSSAILKQIATTSGNVVEIENAKKVNIKGGKITSESTFPNAGIKILNCESGKVNTTVENVGGHGVRIEDSSNFEVYGVIKNVGATGVSIAPTTKNVENIYVNVQVYNCALTSASSIGVYFASGDDYIVKNSTIESNIYDAGFVGIFPGGDNNTCVNCLVDGSGIIEEDGGHGYWIHDSRDITLINCKSTRSKRSGFLTEKAHVVEYVGCSSFKNEGAGFSCVYHVGSSGRYPDIVTNKDVGYSNCIAMENSQNNIGVWAGFVINGYSNVNYSNCQAHDYQATKTQARGLTALTNVNTSNINFIGCDFTTNIVTSGISVDETYLTGINSYSDNSGYKIGFWGKEPQLKTNVFTATGYNTDQTLVGTTATLEDVVNVLGTVMDELKLNGILL